MPRRSGVASHVGAGSAVVSVVSDATIGRARPGGAPLPPFEWVLEQHAAPVLKLLVRAAGPDAEDCFQETMLAALRAYPGLEHGTNLRGWLMTIARRKVVDSWRTSARRPLPIDELEVIDEAEREQGSADGELWERVRRLPAKQRRAVGMRFVEDRSYADIAGAMAISQDAVRRNVHEGIKTLRRSLR